MSAWIEAFTRPGDLVIDPFMGSGTAPLAAARLGRRALGIDLSPLAVMLARLVAAPPDPASVERGMEGVRRHLATRRVTGPGFSGTFADLYSARCGPCGGRATLAHAVWSVRRRCGCGHVFALAELPRGSRGNAAARPCPACGSPLPRSGGWAGEELVRLFTRCESCGLREGTPGVEDRRLAEDLEAARGGIDVWTPAGVELRYPGEVLLSQLRHVLRERPVLDELWTGRNFVATGLLLEAVDEQETDVREALRVSLSAIVKATSRMPTVNTGGWRHKGTGLSSHLLGVFPLHLEQNALEELERHVARRLLPGLASAGARPRIALREGPLAPGDLALVEDDAAAALARLPAECAAMAFADPPYGDAIQYAELSLPHLAWLARPRTGEALRSHVAALLGRAVEHEVVENRAQGKDRASFLARLSLVLRQVHRVVRPGGVVIVTFNAPDEDLVRGVVEAGQGARLVHEETVRQEAFKASHKGAWHRRTAGGTLYLRFARVE